MFPLFECIQCTRFYVSSSILHTYFIVYYIKTNLDKILKNILLLMFAYGEKIPFYLIICIVDINRKINATHFVAIPILTQYLSLGFMMGNYLVHLHFMKILE